jgi:hypothetical protein
MRLARESAIQEHIEENVDLDALLQDVDDDKTFAAMGVAKTISTVRDITLDMTHLLFANVLFLHRLFPPSIPPLKFWLKSKRLWFRLLCSHLRTGFWICLITCMN